MALGHQRYPVCMRDTNLKTKPVLRTIEHREGRKTGPSWATVHTVLRPAPLLKLPLCEAISQSEWGSDAFQTDKEFINWQLELYTHLDAEYGWECRHVDVIVSWKTRYLQTREIRVLVLDPQFTASCKVWGQVFFALVDCRCSEVVIE